MSTDIVTFPAGDANQSQRLVSYAALELYFEISLPLMVVTFAAWYGFYWWEMRKERLESKRKSAQCQV
jgi:hypothetical protein